MCHAGSRAHVLHVARLDDRTVAHAVLVRQRSLEDVGDDFHVAVRMRRKSAAPGYAVIVHHAQGAKLNMLRVIVVRE